MDCPKCGWHMPPIDPWYDLEYVAVLFSCDKRTVVKWILKLGLPQHYRRGARGAAMRVLRASEVKEIDDARIVTASSNDEAQAIFNAQFPEGSEARQRRKAQGQPLGPRRGDTGADESPTGAGS